MNQADRDQFEALLVSLRECKPEETYPLDRHERRLLFIQMHRFVEHVKWLKRQLREITGLLYTADKQHEKSQEQPTCR